LFVCYLHFAQLIVIACFKTHWLSVLVTLLSVLGAFWNNLTEVKTDFHVCSGCYLLVSGCKFSLNWLARQVT